MTSTKCSQCRLVNFATAEVCKRCGASIAEVTTPPPSLGNLRIPLIQCPACDASISSQATACPHCGQPLLVADNTTPLELALRDSEPLSQSPATRSEYRSPMQAAMTCPQCGSDSSVTFEMAHASGSSTGNLGGLTYSPGIGLGGFGGKTSHQTQLAVRTAPPRRPVSSVIAVVVIGGIIFLFLLLFAVATAEASVVIACIVVIAAVTGSSYFLNMNFKKDLQRYEQNVERWRRSVICMRCGHSWYR